MAKNKSAAKAPATQQTPSAAAVDVFAGQEVAETPTTTPAGVPQDGGVAQPSPPVAETPTITPAGVPQNRGVAQASPPAPPPLPADSPTVGRKGRRYICNTPCRFNNREFKKGDTLTVYTPMAIPSHFDKSGE